MARVNARALDAMTATPDVMALREVGLAQLNNSGRWNGAVVNALIRHASKLPRELYKSLTWDRGSEMADHNRFTVATDIKVYFCDLQHPWHRGSNENTNGLLRQYFPKGTDLSVYSQARLNVVARQLNERPRKTLNFDTPAERFHQTVASTG
jgi:IS30 family transposase